MLPPYRGLYSGKLSVVTIRGIRLPLLVALVVALGVGFWALRGQHSVHASTAVTETATQPPAVPVTVVPANVRDVPVYLRGLGTVQAFNVVGVKAQVNGMLIAIPVQEGQEVHQGDVVAQIDPRPYQAILDQATAQRAEDAANCKVLSSIFSDTRTSRSASSPPFSRSTISRRRSTS